MKNLINIFSLLLFPFLFLVRFALSLKQSIYSHRGRWERGNLFLFPFLFSLFVTLSYADNNSINGTCPGEIIEQINGTTVDVSHAENGAISGGGNDRYRMTFPVAGILDISAINRDTSRNENYRFYVSRNSCGNADSDWNIVSAEYGKTHNTSVSVNVGDVIYVRLQSITTEPNNGIHYYALTLDFTALTTTTTTNNICYTEEIAYTGCTDEMGIGCKQKITINNQSRYTFSDVKVGISDINNAMIKDCGIDNTSVDCNESNWVDFGFDGDEGIGFGPISNFSPNTKHSIYTESNISSKLPGVDNLYVNYTRNGILHRGKMDQCKQNFCEKSEQPGFQLVDQGSKPHGEQLGNETFEVFCYEDSDNKWHDLIALPIKNNSNNFVFNNKVTKSNYYDLTDNPRAEFHAIEINANTMSLVTSYSNNMWEIATDGNTYKVMGTEFSNINLIGTPLKIEWGETGELSGCNETKLRKALGQAVKYNTINGPDGIGNDGESICKISNMKFKILGKYRFLEYQNSEVLQHSCKEMATYIPNNLGILDDESVDGYFNILTSEPYYPNNTVPSTNGSRDNGQDIGARTTDGSNNRRPITVYCKYQTDLQYVWTFLTALDAKVTQYKTDLVTKQDTCSQMGLYFYVPNTKTTFNRVRKYLKKQKTGNDGWENYTGTIEEKIKALHPGNIYYLSKFKDVQIWPYGPLGVYFPLDGNHKADGSSADWGDGANTPKEYMSGSPMNSSDSGSMGEKGWVSILGTQDLNKTNDWWISDIGAGEEIGKAIPNSNYTPQGDHPIQSTNYKYYEPNGNYTKNAWLNFLFDSEGWIYHNDDWYDNYPYYDYMCMSETNYDPSFRYSLVPGFFNIIERSTRTGNTPPNFSDDALTTQIVNKAIKFDIILYSIDATTGTIDTSLLEVDENKSVGVYLAADNNGLVELIQKIGNYANFEGSGRISMSGSSGFNSPIAIQKAFIKFYYCNDADSQWDTCWEDTGTTDRPFVNPKAGGGSGGSSDSYDFFSIRPKEFSITDNNVSMSKKRAGKSYTFTLEALDNANTAVQNYNETVSIQGASPLLDYNEILPNCKTGNIEFTSNDINFTNGVATVTLSYDEVGDLNLTLLESKGSEYAKIDDNDTDFSEDMDDTDLSEPSGDEEFREITPATISLTFIPDHFEVNATLTDHHKDSSNPFTYLSDDLNMSSTLELIITAITLGNSRAANYNTDCYANPIDLDIAFAYDPDPETDIPNTLDTIRYFLEEEDSGHTLENNSTDIKAISITDISNVIFPAGDHNGSADINISLNFDRKYNEVVNPFEMDITDINVTDNTDTSNVVYDEPGINAPDDNATYLFARAKSSEYFYDDVTSSSIVTPISVVVYCDLGLIECGLYSINSITGQTDEYDWYLSTWHDTGSSVDDGNITLIASSGGSVRVNGTDYGSPAESNAVTITSGGINNSVTVSNTSGSTPHDVNITFGSQGSIPGTNTWMIYNQDADSVVLDPFYRVRFIDTYGWAGHGDTGNVVENNASSKKNRRLGW